MRIAISLAVLLAFSLSEVSVADDSPWPLLFQDDFESGLTHWRSPDPAAFRITADGDGHVLDQFQQSQVLTPVRSPFNRAVVKDVVVGSFQMDVKFKSTARDYPHRSLCLFFGYQDPAHLYYVHFGQRTDDHANQIFIVNDAPRVKISTQTTPGTPWDGEWHHARITRNVETGEINIYFDDLGKPVMTAVDKTFPWGRVGVGSFDDTGLFDDFTLHGEVAVNH
ncbi:MAG: hypothetical protein KDA75_19140 [Planctomycetaceae bacterium]|nr:hypothetical protein [Planctomycetaceae bacterium]